MDVWEYFLQKEKEFEQNSAYPDGPAELKAVPGTSDQEGTMRAVLGLTEDAYLQVFEYVVIENNTPHRAAYSYALISDEAFAWGWERDPYGHPEMPVHEHSGAPERKRIATRPVSLKAVFDQAWWIVSLQAEAPP